MAAPTTTPESLGPDPIVTTATEAEPQVLAPFDEDDQPRATWERAIGWVIIAACTWMVFCILDPHLSLSPLRFGDIFKNTTTNGGDMGAHVWWPHFLIHNWFPKLRLSGWAPDWYAGFPAGEYYFPVPALMVGALDLIMPYNVAFKIVTISGPLMLPGAAYYFASKLRAPWPAPPAFAIAAFGTLVQTRNDWQIYGGNIASTLAGEFSFTIALAFALFGLGALAHTLDTGKKRWLPAVFIALAIMSHIVVGIFIAIAATLLWLTRRPSRTWRIALPVGLVAFALTAVWTLPLYANQAYTQSMRYTKLLPRGKNKIPSWMMPIGPVRHTLEGFWNGLIRDPIDTNAQPPHRFAPTLWLPWWIWLLAAVAIIAAGWYRRRSTFVLLLTAFIFGVMFIEWPEHAIWNTRFLPFWMLSWALIAAMGATEIARFVAMAARWAYRWIRDGDLQDARARAWAEVATADTSGEAIDEQTRKDAAWALAERRFDKSPAGWEPPDRLRPEVIAKRARFVGSIALAVIVAVGGIFAMKRAWAAKSHNPQIAIRGWAAWNYAGYEEKAAWPQYNAVMTGMEQVADQYGNGRALWEPSSGSPDPINTYGTSLALELLPLYTHGKIDSMEGIYFESSATTSWHFLMVAECSEHPSDPVRGLVYGTPEKDFDLCVKHMQDLGVRYLMAWTPEVQKLAADNPNLKLVKTIPQTPPLDAPAPQKQLKDWKVYEVAGSDLVVPMTQEPVVYTHLNQTKYSQCWNQPWTDTTTTEPELNKWECAVVPWYTNRDLQKIKFTQSGPSSWRRVPEGQLASVQPKPITDVGTVSNVTRSVDKISFDVSPNEIGKPVEVRESFYPNWQVSGAKGPYRLAPNTMVVIPTSTHVTLNYGLTKVDWLGRFITIAGVVGLALLALWTGATRWAATTGMPSRDPDGEDNGNGSSGNGTPSASDDEGDQTDDTEGPPDDVGDAPPPDDPGPEPDEQKEPAPALP